MVFLLQFRMVILFNVSRDTGPNRMQAQKAAKD
jgi:hypothetical protein